MRRGEGLVLVVGAIMFTEMVLGSDATASLQDAKAAKTIISSQCRPLLYQTGDARSLFPPPARALAPYW